jgi:hypothetical protein
VHVLNNCTLQRLQNALEKRRAVEAFDASAGERRKERMRQRRIRRKVGACRYYCCPWSLDAYDVLFPKEVKEVGSVLCFVSTVVLLQ